MVEQAGRGIITAGPVVQQMLERIIGKTGDVLALPQIGEALEAAVADMAMAQPDEDGRPCGRRFVVALKRLARLDHRKAARGSDAERLQHFGREHFAHRALQGEPPRSEEHTSELQSLMRISYAVFCLKKKKIQKTSRHIS